MSLIILTENSFYRKRNVRKTCLRRNRLFILVCPKPVDLRKSRKLSCPVTVGRLSYVVPDNVFNSHSLSYVVPDNVFNSHSLSYVVPDNVFNSHSLSYVVPDNVFNSHSLSYVVPDNVFDSHCQKA